MSMNAWLPKPEAASFFGLDRTQAVVRIEKALPRFWRLRMRFAEWLRTMANRIEG